MTSTEFKNLLARGSVRVKPQPRPKKAGKRPQQPVEAKAVPSAPKYRNVHTEIDGITFASKREAARYQDLRMLEQAGEITGLELQKKYPLFVEGTLVCNYVADFVYVDKKTNRTITEDCKGFRTPLYKLKKKLMQAIYFIEILET